MPGGGRGGSHIDGPAIRKVYLLDKERSTPGKPVLSAVTVKTGISDGSNTEVQEGLKEGDVVITGTATSSTTTAAAPTVNPFGGPFGGGRRR
jgi:multidrug efflux pump subunit AcrA (membrane-fusion protein)